MVDLIRVKSLEPGMELALVDGNVHNLLGARHFLNVINVAHEHVWRVEVQEDATRGSGLFRGKDNLLIYLDMSTTLVHMEDTGIIKAITIGGSFASCHLSFDNNAVAFKRASQNGSTTVTGCQSKHWHEA